MDIIKESKQYLRLLDNYYISEEIKKKRIINFLQEVIKYEFQHVKILDASLQNIFDKLCEDILKVQIKRTNFALLYTQGNKYVSGAQKIFFAFFSVQKG